jgi:hypothetical protein
MKRVIRISIAIVAMGALVLGYYFFLSKRMTPADKKEKAEYTEYQAIVSKNMKSSYPSTPRSVVKWYNRIITEFYARDHKDEQIDKLCDQAQLLMDTDLLRQNPRDQYIKSVKGDILNYKNRKAKIIQAKVCSTNDVEYSTYNGFDVAFVWTYYFSKEGSDYTKTYQQFCLRQDGSGKWKILTWKLVDGDPDMFD